MEVLRFAALLAMGLLVISGLVLGQGDGSEMEKEDDTLKPEDECVNLDAILDLVKDLEDEMDNPGTLWDAKEREKDSPSQRRKRGLGYSNYQGYGGNYKQQMFPYLGGARLLPWLGGYNGYSGYASGYQNYGYSRQPFYYFKQSFNPGNYHVQNNCGRTSQFQTQAYSSYQHNRGGSCVVRNYYKTGTYTTAKTEYLALPFVQVVPVTTTTSVDYVGYINRGLGYTATLCNSCQNGNPQIEIRCNARPYNHLVRRFNFLPGSARQKVQYGAPRNIARPAQQGR